MLTEYGIFSQRPSFLSAGHHRIPYYAVSDVHPDTETFLIHVFATSRNLAQKQFNKKRNFPKVNHEI